MRMSRYFFGMSMNASPLHASVCSFGQFTR